MAETDKISLRDVDIIVSYREATEERRENLYAVLAHLAYTYTDYRLWLMEAAAAPRFDWQRLSDPKIRHVFIHHDGPVSQVDALQHGRPVGAQPRDLFSRRRFHRPALNAARLRRWSAGR